MKNITVVLVTITIMMGGAHSSEPLSTLELEPKVVSNSRLKEKRSDVPLSISVIDKKTIKSTKANSLHEILNKVPGVNMVDLGSEQHMMAIRQPISTKGKFLYLEDGVPIRPSGVFNHNALIEANMAGLNKIEVIRGPSSSLYGSEAIGGTINLITQQAAIKPEGEIGIRTNNLGYRRIDASGSYRKKSLGITAGGYFGERNNGPRDHSDFNKTAINSNLDYSFSDKTTLKFSGAFIDYLSDMTGSVDSTRFYGEDFTSNQTFTWRKIEAKRGKFTLENDWSKNSFTKMSLFYRNSLVGQNPSYRVKDDRRNALKAHGLINNNSVNSYGTLIQHQLKLPDFYTEVIVGAYYDYSLNHLEEKYISVSKNGEGLYTGYLKSDSLLTDYEVNLYNVASYTQVKVKPLKKLTINLGVRGDYFAYDYSNSLGAEAFSGSPNQKNTFKQLTPKVGVTYKIVSTTGIFGSYSWGFLPPQVSELYRGTKAPTLVASHYINYEVGGWSQFSKLLKADWSVYYLEGKNEQVNVRLENGESKVKNAGRTGHSGFEWGLESSFVKGLKARVNGAHSIHEYYDFENGNLGVNYAGNVMEQAPKWIVNAGLTLNSLSLQSFLNHKVSSSTLEFLSGFSLGFEYQKIGEYFMDAENLKTYPGYQIYNMRASYKYRGIGLWFNILNLTDEHYATRATRSFSWGRYKNAYTTGEDRSFNFGVTFDIDWRPLNRR